MQQLESLLAGFVGKKNYNVGYICFEVIISRENPQIMIPLGFILVEGFFPHNFTFIFYFASKKKKIIMHTHFHFIFQFVILMISPEKPGITFEINSFGCCLEGKFIVLLICMKSYIIGPTSANWGAFCP